MVQMRMVLSIYPVWTNHLLCLFCLLLSITVQTKSSLTNDAEHLIASYAGHMKALFQPIGLAIQELQKRIYDAETMK
jgi:hypothetical protein